MNSQWPVVVGMLNFPCEGSFTLTVIFQLENKPLGNDKQQNILKNYGPGQSVKASNWELIAIAVHVCNKGPHRREKLQSQFVVPEAVSGLAV